MKRKIVIMALLCAALAGQSQVNGTGAEIIVNRHFPKAATLDSVLHAYAPAYLPGAVLTLYSASEGWWTGAAGYASLEKQIPMQANDLQYLQSVSKMYLATAMLLLKEKGRIDFDQPITRYLPARYAQTLVNAPQITVRMLLNHTSGVPEYNSEPSFVSQVLLHPFQDFFPEDCLRSIYHQQPQFAPGSRYAYTNTNYLLLSLIADSLTGDHAAYIQQHIFEPLQLKHSFYCRGTGYLANLPLAQSYWDVLNNGVPVNITPLQQITVACSKGDDGIVCTPADAVLFLRGLMEGKLLTRQSLNEMLNFVTDEKGRKRYGMGMIYFDLGITAAYGHGGGGVGSGCGLLYIPSHKLYLFVATNLGVLVDGHLSQKADELKNLILTVLLQ